MKFIVEAIDNLTTLENLFLSYKSKLTSTKPQVR